MKYKHKCSSTRELIGKLQEVVNQIRDYRTILVDWQEVIIPEETVFKVRFKEDEKTGQKQLKLKVEWGEVDDD